MRGAAAGRRRRPYLRRRVAGEGGTGAAGLGLGPGLAVGHERCMRNPLVGLGMGIGARLRPAAAQGSVVSPE